VCGALSDEMTSLSVVYAAAPCQRSLSRVRVPWYSQSYLTLSNLRLPFSSPSTTRRITVEVFDPASTRVLNLFCLLLSLYSLRTDHTENSPHCCRGVFTATLHSSGRCANRIENAVLLVLPCVYSFARCLTVSYLATLWPSTLYCTYFIPEAFAEYSSETSVFAYRSTRRHKLKGHMSLSLKCNFLLRKKEIYLTFHRHSINMYANVYLMLYLSILLP
jgi:hypothetical protein